MTAFIKTGAAVCGLAIPFLWSSAASACSLEIDNNYTITPYVDDGLSRAERVDCALGNLSYYGGEEQGWKDMLGEDGQPLPVQDMAGVWTDAGEFLVVILKDNRVAMRWGGPGNGRFFDSDGNHKGFYAEDGNGGSLNGLRIGEVALDPQTNLLKVGIHTNSAEYCEITSDPDLYLHWNWDCSAMPGTPEHTASAGGGAPVPVMVGGEPDGDACGGAGEVTGILPNGSAGAVVRAGPGPEYPAIDEVPAGMLVSMCESDSSGAWEGIVYPIDGLEDCLVGSPMARQSYQGPCASGWIDMNSVTMIAG